MLIKRLLVAFGIGVPAKTISVLQAHDDLNASRIIMIDIREHDEVLSPGMAERAIHLALSDVHFVEKAKQLSSDNNSKPIAILCHTGHRSKQAALTLANEGLQNLQIVDEGMTAWLKAGLPYFSAQDAKG